MATGGEVEGSSELETSEHKRQKTGEVIGEEAELLAVSEEQEEQEAEDNVVEPGDPPPDAMEGVQSVDEGETAQLVECEEGAGGSEQEEDSAGGRDVQSEPIEASVEYTGDMLKCGQCREFFHFE